MKTLLDSQRLSITLQRLAHEVAEDHLDAGGGTAVIGLQPRGVALSRRIHSLLQPIATGAPLHYGELDITFYRDDLHAQGKGLHMPAQTRLDFSVEGRRVVLVDDVLYTGRTVRAAMDALTDYGRPAKVELLVLIDRRFARELPIQPDFVGQAVDTVSSQKVAVHWADGSAARDEVVLLD